MNPPAKSFRDLIVWQKAHEFVLRTPLSDLLPPSRPFAVLCVPCTVITTFHSFWRVLAYHRSFKQELAESAEDEVIVACRDTEPEVRIHLCDLCALLFTNFSLFGCSCAALRSFTAILVFPSIA
jgi:hypothetical protein